MKSQHHSTKYFASKAMKNNVHNVFASMIIPKAAKPSLLLHSMYKY